MAIPKIDFHAAKHIKHGGISQTQNHAMFLNIVTQTSSFTVEFRAMFACVCPEPSRIWSL
jgi:hypothetical protein